MVMNTLQSGFSEMVVSSNTNLATRPRLAFWIVKICCAMTDNTSSSMRLNSSKHAHAPDDARPLKNLAIAR